jgi:hypothetical protein
MRIPTQVVGRVFACCLVAVSSAFAFCQESTPAKPAAGTTVAPAEIYAKVLSQFEKGFISAAEAMPPEKYDFAPPDSMGDFKGVRTFAAQVKHVTEANDFFFHDPNKPLVDFRADIEKLKTKAEIVQALKDSFMQAHAYIDGITPSNAFIVMQNGNTRAGMAAFGIAHFMDHYGQMVEYLRMNGIVPPASRGGSM